jgi:hypothetical protein
MLIVNASYGMYERGFQHTCMAISNYLNITTDAVGLSLRLN